MEFVEGESLGSMLKRDHKLTVEQSAKIIQQTALGLATAHDRGVVHRDIKPGNLMVSSRGSIKIADFGIALSNHDLSSKLTTTGEFVGTPGYLSPEVCSASRSTSAPTSSLAWHRPVRDAGPARCRSTTSPQLGLMLEVVRAEIPDVRQLNQEADAQIAQILARMIAKEPADRYQNCHELVIDLNAHPLVAKGGPITAQTKLSTAAATMIGPEDAGVGTGRARAQSDAARRCGSGGGRGGQHPHHAIGPADAAAGRACAGTSIRARSADDAR